MVKHLFLIIFLFLGALGQAYGAGVYETLSYRVLTVYDGDTILVKGRSKPFKVRLAGIDSPETGFDGIAAQPFSKAAKRYLSRLIKDRNVKLKPYGKGGYNRLLAEVFYGNDNMNLKMVQAGLAEVYRGKRPETFNSSPYFKAETAAKKSKKGMWAQGDSYQSPRAWRKSHPRK